MRKKLFAAGEGVFFFTGEMRRLHDDRRGCELHLVLFDYQNVINKYAIAVPEETSAKVVFFSAQARGLLQS
jgi:hypothetical protein